MATHLKLSPAETTDISWWMLQMLQDSIHIHQNFNIISVTKSCWILLYNNALRIKHWVVGVAVA